MPYARTGLNEQELIERARFEGDLMSCEFVEELSALIDGELSPDRARVLEGHVTQCHECQTARTEFLNLRNQILTFQAAPDPVGTHNRLAQVVGSDYAAAKPKVPVGFPGWFRPSPAFAAIAFVLVTGIVGLLVYRSVHKQVSGPDKTNQYIASQGNKSSANATAKNPASTFSATDTNKKGTVKTGGRPPKTKSRPRVETPKPRFNPPELTSPYGTQVIAANNSSAASVDKVQPADTESLTARHFEQSELLLRSFRNVREDETRAEVSYERKRAQKLVYQNIMLRREADASGDVQVSSLLESLEPILLDIANLPERPHNDDVTAIKQRVQRKNLVALLQVNSTALVRANE